MVVGGGIGNLKVRREFPQKGVQNGGAKGSYQAFSVLIGSMKAIKGIKGSWKHANHVQSVDIVRE